MKTIDINGFMYFVKYVDNTSLPNTIGTCDYEIQVIEIKNNLSMVQKKKTLIHELTHAFLWCYGFPRSKFDDEALCDFVGTYAQKIVDLANDILADKGEK